jgi:predicted nuclease of predicted toxin-antitoxin system
MKVLLDENVPRKLKWRLMERGLDVATVPERGWSGIKNGELLVRAQEEFDVVLTMDQSIEYQQEVAGFDLALVTMQALNNEYETLLPLMDEVEDAIQQARAGTVISVAA